MILKNRNTQNHKMKVWNKAMILYIEQYNKMVCYALLAH
jgi:hypothetical protein